MKLFIGFYVFLRDVMRIVTENVTLYWYNVVARNGGVEPHLENGFLPHGAHVRRECYRQDMDQKPGLPSEGPGSGKDVRPTSDVSQAGKSAAAPLDGSRARPAAVRHPRPRAGTRATAPRADSTTTPWHDCQGRTNLW